MADLPGSSCKERIAYRICCGQRGVGVQFAERACLYREDTRVHQSQFPGYFGIHAIAHIIKVGMGCVYADVVFDGFLYHALHVGAAGDPFEAGEDEWMVADDEVAATRQGLVDDGFRNVEANEHAGDDIIKVADLQPAIVVTLLVYEWGQLLYGAYYVFDGHIYN